MPAGQRAVGSVLRRRRSCVADEQRPVILGWHLARSEAVTVEVVEKLEGDAGGAPARVDGRLQIVESFRFPPDFDQAQIPVFNTNTFWFGVEALAQAVDLTWFMVRKKVDGLDAVQFERLIGEITGFADSAFLRVEREGPASRFVPVKTPEDLAENRARMLAAWRSRG
jgi:UTP--glucose-1-phosphate uridylyltransferase